MRTVELKWTQVRVGLFIALALFVFFSLLAALGAAGSPFVDRAHLHGQFDDVSGIAVGSPVEMGGVIVGEVARIDLPDLDTGKVPLRLSVDRSALERIGASSEAFAGSHALVGQRFIGVTPRRPDEAALVDGDNIVTAPSATADGMMEEARKALVELRGLLVDVHEATGAFARAGKALDDQEGTVGRLFHDRELYDLLVSTARHADELAGLVADPQLARDLKGGVGAFARTANRVAKGEGILGRLTADGESTRRLDHTLQNVERVSVNLAEARGTLGALIGDPALLGRWNALLTQMDALVADVRRNPQRYLKLAPF